MSKFKVRCIKLSDISDTYHCKYGELGKVYEAQGDMKDHNIFVKGLNEGGVLRSRFELVEEEKPVSSNPCIATEEVKIIKTKIKTGSLDNMHLLLPGDDKTINFILGNDHYQYDSNKLRKLARQLDEIANVLDTQE